MLWEGYFSKDTTCIKYHKRYPHDRENDRETLKSTNTVVEKEQKNKKEPEVDSQKSREREGENSIYENTHSSKM